MDAAAAGAAPHGEDAPVEHPALPYTPAFKVGDIVYGTNLFANDKGARVHIMYHEGLYGYMPVDQNPLTPEEWSKTSPGASAPPRAATSRMGAGQEDGSGDGGGGSRQARAPRLVPRHAHNVALGAHMRLMQGHTRPFKVLSIPPDMQPHGRGPLLSAYHYDMDMLWARMSQFHQLCAEEAVVFNVKVVSANSGGLIGNLMGLEVFIPNPHICRRTGLSLDKALEHLLGKEVEVAMLDMKPYGFVKASETLARRHRLTRPGTLVWGEVSKVTEKSAFVHIEGLDFDAALFNVNISSDTPAHAGDVFSPGERICAAVYETLGEDRVRLSTRVLEAEYGEMHSTEGKAAVFRRAAEGPGSIRLPEPEARQQRQPAYRSSGSSSSGHGGSEDGSFGETRQRSAVEGHWSGGAGSGETGGQRRYGSQQQRPSDAREGKRDEENDVWVGRGEQRTRGGDGRRR